MVFETQWIKLKKLFGGKTEIFAFLVIFLLAIFLRFVNYEDRFGLAADQARDLLMVREMLRIHSLPLIGPFSASGPFVFGPYWYWIFTIPVLLFPHSLLAPWIFQSLLYTLAVLIMFFIGKEIHGPRFGLLLSLFTAISTSEIKLSTNLIISALVGILTFIILYSFIRYIKDKEIKYLLLLSFLVAVAINTHFEAVPLIFLLPFAVFFGRRNIRHLALAIITFLFPFIPLLIFNIKSHNYELSHIMQLHQQIPQGTPLPAFIRALLGPVNFFPRVWGDTIGGSTMAGWVMIAVFIFMMVFLSVKRNNREEKILVGVFLCMMALIVAYEGKLFENFLGYIFPFMIIFTGLACYYLARFNKVAGFLAVIVIVFFSIFSDFQVISSATNTTIITARFCEKAILEKYPQQKFAIYNYSSINTDKSIPLSLVLDVDGKTDDNGFKIGVGYVGASIYRQVVVEGPLGLRLYDLRGASDNQLKKEDFSPVTASKIYQSTEQWYQ